MVETSAVEVEDLIKCDACKSLPAPTWSCRIRCLSSIICLVDRHNHPGYVKYCFFKESLESWCFLYWASIVRTASPTILYYITLDQQCLTLQSKAGWMKHTCRIEVIYLGICCSMFCQCLSGNLECLSGNLERLSGNLECLSGNLVVSKFN